MTITKKLFISIHVEALDVELLGRCEIAENEMTNKLARGGSSLDLLTLGKAKPYRTLIAELTNCADTMYTIISSLGTRHSDQMSTVLAGRNRGLFESRRDL